MLVKNAQLMQATIARPQADDLAAWKALAGRALVPAGLARPELAEAIFVQHGSAQLARVEQDGRMLLALPLIGGRSATSHLSNAGLALLDPHWGEAALEVLLRHLGRTVTMTGIPATGVFAEALCRAATHHAVLKTWGRAGLRLTGTHDDWFNANFDSKRRNRYRRNAAGLANLPGYAFETLRLGDDVAPWAAAFLGLETAGWKGKRGTALARQHGMAGAYAAAVQKLHASGHLRFWRMQTGGRPIAMVSAIVERGTASFSKIAYDETHARLSPGAMIVLEATRALFEEGGVATIDSCAIPNHPMLDNIWRDRIAMCDMMVAGSNVSATAFALAVAATRLKTGIRRKLRDGLYWAKGRKPS